MGGTWSGQRWSKKPVVEGCTAFDTADLKRLKLLVPGTNNREGSLHWERGGKRESSIGYTLTVGEKDGTFRVQYRFAESKESLDYPVRLVTTGCHLGGVRWWFICPLVKDGRACGRRVRKLYLSGKYFGCRHCHGLAYSSSQRSDSRVYAALRSGMHLRPYEDLGGASIAQLGFALKVLTAGQKRLDRIGKRLNLHRGRKEAKRDDAESRPPNHS